MVWPVITIWKELLTELNFNTTHKMEWSNPSILGFHLLATCRDDLSALSDRATPKWNWEYVVQLLAKQHITRIEMNGATFSKERKAFCRILKSAPSSPKARMVTSMLTEGLGYCEKMIPSSQMIH